MKHLLALLAFCAALPVAARAQAVPRPAGSTFVSLSQSYFSSTQFYDDGGVRRSNGCTFAKNATTLYAEHGFDAKDTGSVQLEFDRDNCGGASTQGLYDVLLSFLHQTHHSATTSFGWTAQAIVPTGYDIGASPRLGYGRFGAQLGLAYGGNFRDGLGYGFYALQSGLRAYIGYPAPQLRSLGTIGTDVGPRVQVIGQLQWDQALGNGQTLTNVGLNPTIFPKYSDLTAIATLRVHLSRSLSLVGSTSGVLYGRNYGIGATSAIGLWDEF